MNVGFMGVPKFAVIFKTPPRFRDTREERMRRNSGRNIRNLRVHLKISFLFLSFLSGYVGLAQKPLPFSETEYPNKNFIVSKQQKSLGSLTVNLTLVTPREQTIQRHFFCRAWLTVKKGQTLIKELSDEIEPSAGCSGFFFPDHQPTKEVMIISKFGDYDGRLLTLTPEGELNDLIGGKSFISPDQKYLFSNYDSDLSGLTIIDLTQNEVVFSKQLNQYLGDWYYRDGQYYAISSDDDVINGETKILAFDFQSRKLIETKKPGGYADAAYRLKVYIDPVELEKCNCGVGYER